MDLISAGTAAMETFVETAILALEIAGAAAILAGGVLAAAVFVKASRSKGREAAYLVFRASLGRSILLGLEFLVAADILKSVLIDHAFEDLGGLVVLMVARTFLSVSLSVEINGHWPWQETRFARERGAEQPGAPSKANL